MTKRNQRGRNSNAVIPNSMLPVGAKRIWNAQAERVWLFNGLEFWSKRDILRNNPKGIHIPAPVEAIIEGVMPEAVVEEIINPSAE